jgi:hypothetical protein
MPSKMRCADACGRSTRTLGDAAAATIRVLSGVPPVSGLMQDVRDSLGQPIVLRR